MGAISKCIFCGSPNLTREHVFSRWTHKFLSPRKTGKALSYVGTSYVDRVVGEAIKLPGQVRDWKVRCVCGGTHLTCNGGWMRAIEDRARPLLIPLIRGDDTRLTPKAQIAIATWSVLKAIVGEYDSKTITHVHHTQRRYLMTHSLPPARGWGVWIGHFERRHFGPEWVSRPFLLVPENVALSRKNDAATYFNSNASTQIVGKLFIHVVHSPMTNFIPRLNFHPPGRGNLFRIWPASQTSIRWPAQALDDRDAAFVTDAIADLLLSIKSRSGTGARSPSP